MEKQLLANKLKELLIKNNNRVTIEDMHSNIENISEEKIIKFLNSECVSAELLRVRDQNGNIFYSKYIPKTQ
jgi:hypothetical protein